MPLLPLVSLVRSAISRSWMLWWRRSLPILLVVCSSLLLTGCVDYDVGLQFDSPNRGAITQHIRLDERLQTLSGASYQSWIETLEQRTRKLGGRLEHPLPQEWLVTIPFSNHTDLEQKFNQFFSPLTADTATGADLPAIESHLRLTRNNFLLVERNHLRYDLDLRSLGLRLAGGDLLFSPSSLLDLEFRLQTPWGARVLDSVSSITAQCQDRDLLWQLIPGEQNHLEAIFWLPSPLGIGTLVIVGLIVGGQHLRYSLRRSPNTVAASTSTSEFDPTN